MIKSKCFLFFMEEEGDSGEPLTDIQTVGKDSAGNQKTIEAEEAHVFPISRASIFFHILMTFACIYYSMLLSNWGDPSVNNEKDDYFEANWVSFWVKLVTQWVSIGVYYASLLIGDGAA